MKTINPTTEETIQEHPEQSPDELQRVIDQAQAGFQEWSKRPIEARVEPLRQLASLLGDHRDELSRLMTTEMGKCVDHAQAEMDLVTAICRYCADEAPKVLADEPKDFAEGRAFVTYQPQGTVFSIQPWNFPFYQVIRNAAPVIASGNAMILSHAPNVWGCAKRLAELVDQTDLPRGVFTSIYANDDDLDPLYADRSVRAVTFTGSAETGRVVAGKAAEHLKKSVLELGGSDAYLVLEDADIDLAVKHCTQGRFVNNGQVCTAAKRLIVHAKVYDRFRDAVVESVKNMTVGDPTEDATDVGPLAREDLRDKLARQVSESVAKGARCLVGGTVPGRKGWFYAPTVLENLSPGMPAYDDELFGPVANLIRVDSEDEAIEVSNGSKYGLGGGIFSQDVERAVAIARDRLDTGMVNINGFSNARPQLPFGGVKNSGYGREHDRYGFLEFVNIKAVRVHE